MSYQIGQVVSVSTPATLYTQQFKGEIAVVTDYIPEEPFAYELTFANGRTLGFAEEELSPVPAEGTANDTVNSPSHYTWLPGIEVIDVTQHFNFNLGNALKYIMRAGRKGDAAEDLRKAARYLQFELKRMESN